MCQEAILPKPGKNSVLQDSPPAAGRMGGIFLSISCEIKIPRRGAGDKTISITPALPAAAEPLSLRALLSLQGPLLLLSDVLLCFL